LPDKVRAGIVASLHTVTEAGWLAMGVGLTMIVNVTIEPVQVLAMGVMAMVAVMGAVPVFVAVKEGIVPLPVPGRPIEGFELVHAKTVPGTDPVREISGTTSELQSILLSTLFTDGMG
jgi:hypothetical protein